MHLWRSRTGRVEGADEFGDSLGAAAQILTVSFGPEPGENDGNRLLAK